MKALIMVLVLWVGGALHTARAALQFDVFVGFEGTIHEGGWFPVVCELFNDGPSFNGVIELTGGQFNNDQVRLVPIELPTNTRKRVVLPAFASGGGNWGMSWDARLRDSRGKVIAERLSIPSTTLSHETTLMAALPRTFGGTPLFPEIKDSRKDLQPTVGRLTVEQFPDSPIALEGLDVVYLNSEKALELSVNQVVALLGWVRSGGHLILAVEQTADVNGTPWLKQFIPMELDGGTTVKVDQEFAQWVKAPPDVQNETSQSQPQRRRPKQEEPAAANPYAEIPLEAVFKEADLLVATGSIKDGSTLIQAQGTPLVVQAPRGRGQVTLFTFSPEREPFRSWKSRSYFWAKLSGIEGEAFVTQQPGFYGGTSLDGLFGALIDSRQIKKLPVTWLLVLLVVYLVIIGPFDQWWLKKINRQMLTWITFPAYVVLFSLLIYFIGYKLRAGETEWNELNVVDILPRGEKVDLRGHTYISIYSSSNARYPIQGQEGHASLRGEYQDRYSGGGGGSSGKSRLVQYGNTFKSEVDVPVWTSLLFINEWFTTNDTPFVASVAHTGSDFQVDIQNLLNQPLSDVRLVINQTLYELQPLKPEEKRTIRLTPEQGTPLRYYVQQQGAYFQQAAVRRKNPLGNESIRLEDRALTGTVASFISYLDEVESGGRAFIAPSGIDLRPQAERGDAVIFAFLPNFSFSRNLNQFSPVRFRQDTLLRLTLPVRQNNTL